MHASNKGILSLIITSFLFALVTVFNRFVPEGIGVTYQLFLRTFLMGILFLAIGVSIRNIRPIKQKDLPLMLLRGVFFAGDFGTFFIAVNHLPLATTLFVFYGGTIMAGFVYGSLALHERLTRIKKISLVAAFVGLFIIYGSGLSSLANVMVILALTAGVCFGLEQAASKKLTHKYAITQINIIGYFTAALVSLPLLFITNQLPSSPLLFSTFPFFFLFALLYIVVSYTSLYGFKHVEAQKASLLLLGEILFVIIIGILFYQENLTINTIVGGLFILTALALPNISLPSIKKRSAL